MGVNGGDRTMAMEMGLRFGVADGGGDRTSSTATVRPVKKRKRRMSFW